MWRWHPLTRAPSRDVGEGYAGKTRSKRARCNLGQEDCQAFPGILPRIFSTLSTFSIGCKMPDWWGSKVPFMHCHRSSDFAIILFSDELQPSH